jgi:hypothetical protein
LEQKTQKEKDWALRFPSCAHSNRTENNIFVGTTAIPKVKNVGKPCEGKLHARFDEEGLAFPAFHSTVKKRPLMMALVI